LSDPSVAKNAATRAGTLHIQGAEQLGWMKRAHELPVVERFP
jgi:hypothetical protein